MSASSWDWTSVIAMNNERRIVNTQYYPLCLSEDVPQGDEYCRCCGSVERGSSGWERSCTLQEFLADGGGQFPGKKAPRYCQNLRQKGRRTEKHFQAVSLSNSFYDWDSVTLSWHRVPAGDHEPIFLLTSATKHCLEGPTVSPLTKWRIRDWIPQIREFRNKILYWACRTGR